MNMINYTALHSSSQKILYSTTTNVVFIEIIVNAAHAADKINQGLLASNKFFSKTLDSKSILIHTTKYLIRNPINELSNYYFDLEEYQCDQGWSINCGIQLATSIVAGSTAGLVKTAMNPLIPWYINVPTQIAFDLCNKFKECSDGKHTLPTYLIIESLSSLALGDGLQDGLLTGLSAYAGLKMLTSAENLVNTTEASSAKPLGGIDNNEL